MTLLLLHCKKIRCGTGISYGLTFAQREKDLRRGADILHSGRPSSDGAPQHTVENLRNILLALEVNAVEVPDEEEEEAGVVHLLGELGKHNV